MKWLLILTGLLAAACGPDYAAVKLDDRHVVVDSFQQGEGVTKLDVLVAIDTSSSMNDDLEDVGAGILALAEDISILLTDFRIVFVTADLTNPQFVGPYTSDSSKIDMMLAPSTLDYTGVEAGFAAAYNFIADPAREFDLYPTTKEYDPFLREDADFVLFLISDEEEQSSITAELFSDWLDSLATDSRLVDVVSIVSTNTDCNSNEIGQKYIDLMTLRSKSAIDLCADDWSAWLSQSSFITAKRDTIVLTQVPIINSIVVYVDEDPTDDVEPSTWAAWTYDEERNAVILDAAPDYGTLVTVGYESLD